MKTRKMHRKHIGIISLIIVIVLIAIASAMPVHAAATTGTNVKGTITIQKGSSKTLTVKDSGKVKWSSSRTSVATVSSSGKVKAKKTGSTKITAKTSKKTYTCTVKVVAKTSTGAAGGSAKQTLKMDTAGMNNQDAAIFRKMYAMRSAYYEGRKWTNNNFYAWKGGIFYGGYGCSGFAFILSDAAFGSAPARRHNDFNNVKVGDILRVDNNCHSVIVMKVVGNNFVVAEGNYNSSIHWGRVMSRSEARNGGTYVMTRR